MKLILDEVATRLYGKTQWESENDVFAGSLVLSAVPWRGKVRRWLRGVVAPVDAIPSRHTTRAQFDAQKHYRFENGIISVQGLIEEVFAEKEDKRITDAAELDALYRSRIKGERITMVDAERQDIHWYPSVDDHEEHPDSGLYLNYCYFWKPEVVGETAEVATIRFRPSFLAQLRHFFRLKPWTYNVHAKPASA